MGEGEFGGNVESDVACEEATGNELILAFIELTTDGLVIGVEGPLNLAGMKAVLELCEYATVAHAFHALSLVAFGNICADEGEGYGVKAVGEHLVDIVDEFARDAVLVGG